jgi:A/G-specific adenine glycosylase
VETLRENLLGHYDRRRRDLPWRGETDPYRIWVSEVMLQQTRVDTVIPYYMRWMGLFPDVEALARATRDEVLLAWQGLGYYRRAARLHEAAHVLRERHGGALPASHEGLRALPGVGEYTAGALASIAFGEAVPAVDGNVRRVLSRLFDRARPTAAWLRSTAALLVDPGRPGDWNQALMELGATVCTPREPACPRCPLAEECAACRAGTQNHRPAPPERRDVPTATFATAVVVDAEGRALLVRRPEDGLLGGMWSFPEREVRVGEGAAAREASREAARQAGATLTDARPALPLGEVRHRFTHLDARYRPLVLAGEGADAENRRWLPLERRDEIAFPTAQEKIARAAQGALADR